MELNTSYVEHEKHQVEERPTLTTKLIHLWGLKKYRNYSGQLQTKPLSDQHRKEQEKFISDARMVQEIDEQLRVYLLSQDEPNLVDDYEYYYATTPTSSDFSQDEVDYIESRLEVDPFLAFAYEHLPLPGNRTRIQVSQIGTVANSQHVTIVDIETGSLL